MERIESAVIAAWTEAVVQSGVGYSKERVRNIERVGVIESEAGVIQDIEKIGSELQLHSFIYRELAAQCQIELIPPEAAHRIASEKPLPRQRRSGRVDDERGGIEPLRRCFGDE